MGPIANEKKDMHIFEGRTIVSSGIPRYAEGKEMHVINASVKKTTSDKAPVTRPSGKRAYVFKNVLRRHACIGALLSDTIFLQFFFSFYFFHHFVLTEVILYPFLSKRAVL